MGKPQPARACVDGTNAAPPSPWVVRWAGVFAGLLPTAANALDVACGSGRHTRLLKQYGYRVTGIDRDAAALAACDASETINADLEQGSWPLAGRLFDLIVVTNYLHRPLFPTLRASLAPDAVLIYETFAHGNGMLGKPSNPDFLLRPGELLEHSTSLRVIAYEDGFLENPRRALVQRLCAVRVGDAAPSRLYPLDRL